MQQRQAERLAGATPGVEAAALDEQLLAAVLSEQPIIPAAGTKLARSSSPPRTTASSWPIGMRSRVATSAKATGWRVMRGAIVACARGRERLPPSMRLLPREQDRLLLFLAAELRASGAGAGCVSTRPRRSR